MSATSNNPLNIDWSELAQHAMDFVTTTDEERVENARNFVENRVLRGNQATEWMQSTGWEVASNQNGSQALRNPATRDATVYGLIQNFYNRDHDAGAIQQAYIDQGFHNGSTTQTHLINMGPDSLARSNSNHEATLVVDESQSPPMIMINFRGSNMGGTPRGWREGAESDNLFVRIFDMAMHYFGISDGGNTAMPEWYTHLQAARDYLTGGKVDSYQQEADAFWEDAGPEITRVIQEVQARNPGTTPEIILSGHSYGVDGATRMVPKLAGALPDLVGNIQLIGFGGISSFSRSEHQQITDLLGGAESGRAIQYTNSNDVMVRAMHLNPFGNKEVGEIRVIDGIGPDGHQYELPARAMAMMETVEDAIDDDPRAAQENARALVAAYQADPDNFLSRLAEYTSSPPPGGDLLSVLLPSGSAQPALS